MKKLKLLIADDVSENIDPLEQFLGIDYEILVAGTGTAAVQMATKELPFCILMDIQMPDMNGLQATKILKANSRTKNIPIIIITAYYNEFDAQYCNLYGADHFLRKPVNLSQLQKVVGQFAQLAIENNTF